MKLSGLINIFSSGLEMFTLHEHETIANASKPFVLTTTARGLGVAFGMVSVPALDFVDVLGVLGRGAASSSCR
jgi:hypothetical protein